MVAKLAVTKAAPAVTVAAAVRPHRRKHNRGTSAMAAALEVERALPEIGEFPEADASRKCKAAESYGLNQQAHSDHAADCDDGR